jgi:hypothetical protein
MLVDLRSKVGLVLEDVENDIEKIRAQGHSEGFEDHEIDLLLKMYLSGLKTKRQQKWILYEKPRLEKQKNLLTIMPKVAKMTITMFQRSQHLIIL